MVPSLLLSDFWIVANFIVTATAVLTAFNGTLSKPGDSVTLRCQTDQPSATVQFLRNGVVLTSNGKYSIASNNSINAITVSLVGEQDVGEYECKSETPPYDSASVSLLSRPVVSPLQPPTGLIEGGTLQLTCSTWGWPTPTCTWLENNNVLSTSDPRVSFGSRMTATNASIANAQLTITGLKRSDQTYYTCSAFDGSNTTSVTAYVRVKDRLAAVWPSIGIIIIVVLTIVIIIFAERRRKKNEAKFHPQ